MVEHMTRTGAGTRTASDDDEGRTPMKRLVFLLLGPTLIAFVIWLIVFCASGPCAHGLALFCAVIFFLLGCVVSAIAKPVDGYLSRALPLPLGALLNAILGGTIGVGMVLAAFRMMLPLWILAPFAISGAYCAGLCSVFSGDAGR